ncbi:MAG: hypothetical protein ACXAEX_00650 [Promethearchaeota archaeon]|jgi:hypothetical protein
MIQSIESEETPKIHTEIDEILGDLNPMYFEESINPKDALQKVHSIEEFNNYIVRHF